MLALHLITAAIAIWRPLAATAYIISPRRPQETVIPTECIAAVVEAPPLPPALSFSDLITSIEIQTVTGEPIVVNTMVATVTVTVGRESVTVLEPGPAATVVKSLSPSSASSTWTSSSAASPTTVSSPPTPPAASPTRVVNCDTVCICDENSSDFFWCISNPDCEECLRRSQVPSQTQRARLF